MIKLLYIVSTLKRSGPIVQIYYIIKHLDLTKYKVNIITLSYEDPDTMIDDFADLGVEIQSLGLSRISGHLFGKSRLNKFIKTIQPDIIHTQGFRSDLYSLSFPKDIHCVSSMQNYPFFDYPMKFGKLKGETMARKQLAVIKQRKNYVACAKSVSELFKKNHNIDMMFIQNGADTDKYKPVDENEKISLKQKLKVPEDKTIFISVGSLIARKDMTTVIKGFKKAAIKNALLLIAGDGIERALLTELATKDPNIVFLGNVPNVKEYLQVSDFFISASWAEGLPNTVLEAMACSVPVILSSIRPHKEFFDNNSFRYFFPEKDFESLSRLMQEIMSEDMSSLKNKMLKIITENFTAEVMSEKYQKLYTDLKNGK